jgi:hypothetical protein
MRAIGGSAGAEGPSLAKRYLQNEAGSLAPRFLSLFNTDNLVRDQRTILDGFLGRIPGLAEGLEPRRDNFGKPMTTPSGWPWRAINPFTIAEGLDGPARREMARWAESPNQAQFSMPSPTANGVDLRAARNSVTGQSAYDRMLEILTEKDANGKTLEDRMNDLVRSEGYKALVKNGVEDPVYREHPAAKMLRNRLELEYRAAQQKMLQEPGFEDLRKAMNDQRINSAAVPLGRAPIEDPTLKQLLNRRHP